MRKREMGRILALISLFLLYVALAVQVFSFSFGHSLCSSHDSIALLQFKQSLAVADYPLLNYYDFFCPYSYPKTTSWNRSSMDCCRWDGVTCDRFTGHVIGLDLSCSKLEGTIHPNSSLFQLRHLQTLDLSLNNFSLSHIPRGIGQLVSLMHLNLSYSMFEGGIPLEISHLSNLVSLDLSYLFHLQFSQEGFNMLSRNLTKLEVLSLSLVNISSKIPMNVSSSSSLRYLDLGYGLHGEFPKSIFLLPNLETLRLSGNYDLTVSFPKFNWSSSYMLTELDLSHNNISGGLPGTLGSLKALKLMNLHWCNLVGPIPESIRNLSQITQLDLSYNHLESKIPDAFSNLQKLTFLALDGNAFTGLFPSSLVNLTKLEDLGLSDNSLSGPLPLTANRLQNLYRLVLSNNSLNGSIPSWMLSLPSLTELRLESNHLSGPLPEFKSIGNLNSLLLLNLSHNNLTGHIPVEMKNMSTLEVLDLSFNQLTGKIPEELTSLTFLAVLNLSHNHLVGPIPYSNQFNTFPDDSYFGNSDLCGFPLSNECGHHKSASVPELLVEQEEDEPSFLTEMTWKSVLIGYGCGLIFGFTVLYLIYCFERPRWFVDFFATITNELTYRTKRRGQRRRNFHRRRH
ncbi:receptor-like protein 9DC3 [Nicotiana sylvestris]|uniref:LRR receptor-like serine/threonine-protein kinase FLS2 n=1 Tax=Nicotiana sylvestris TaxID=4096 RepID=A0A1U7XKZ6_NICSY|nr:PREDICTED: LRR receptor-like serine/threonine-protein kinase FLS2 [Nicotiana sylvestris]